MYPTQLSTHSWENQENIRLSPPAVQGTQPTNMMPTSEATNSEPPAEVSHGPDQEELPVVTSAVNKLHHYYL